MGCRHPAHEDLLCVITRRPQHPVTGALQHTRHNLVPPIPCMEFLWHQGEGPSPVWGRGTTPCSRVALGAELESGESVGELGSGRG